MSDNDNREKGQSTVEFVLTMVFLIAFTLLFYQMSLVMAFGNYVHYATFMAARAYLSGGDTEQDQHERAINYMAGMVKRSVNQPGTDKLPMVAKGAGGSVGEVTGMDFDYPGGDALTTDWALGVRYSFKARWFLMEIGATNGGAGFNQIPLTAESFLGKEVSDQDCRIEMSKRRVGGIQAWYDNGC